MITINSNPPTFLGAGYPTFFVADISANHDGLLSRAIDLIQLAAESGADAVKFQNFIADKIVSKKGFENLKVGHQASWGKSVYDVYKLASIPFEWTPYLKTAANESGIEYFTTPYDLEIVDWLDPYVNIYKIGSGDITWFELIEKVAKKNKPVFLGTGASNIADVEDAYNTIVFSRSHNHNPDVVLMQCNTNYTAMPENLRHINLNVLKQYEASFHDAILGLSDHTFGHSTVLGAVALGARVIEKHFTDDRHRDGPDHKFSMMPQDWREMVYRTRDLEDALGRTLKFVCDNEQETHIIQRRCLRAKTDLKQGTILSREMLDILRPAPDGSISPMQVGKVLGKTLIYDVEAGDVITPSMLR